MHRIPGSFDRLQIAAATLFIIIPQAFYGKRADVVEISVKEIPCFSG